MSILRDVLPPASVLYVLEGGCRLAFPPKTVSNSQ